MEPPLYSPSLSRPSSGPSSRASSSSRRPGPSRQASSSIDAIAQIPSFSPVHSLPPRHPVHVALDKDLDLKKDSLRIGLTECDIIIAPAAGALFGENNDGSQGSGRINGYLQVVSTSAKKIQGIRVRLVRRQVLAFPQDHGLEEEDEVVEAELMLGAEGMELSKGISTFEFRFTVPSTCSPHDDTSYAKIQHVILAKVIGSGKGFFSRDLRAEELVWVVPAPILGETESLGLNVHSQGVTDALGPFSFDLNASAFIVASALDISLTLHCPPPTLTVYGLKIYLAQRAVLTSYRNPEKTATIRPPKQFVVDRGPSGPYNEDFVKKHRGEAMLEGKTWEGKEWNFQKVARLPSDRRIRPSTHSATETGARFSCELVIDIVYTSTVDDDPDSTLSQKVWVATVFSKPVSLGSCGCFQDRLALPDYSEKVGSLETVNPYMKDYCLCLRPWDSVEKEELRGRESHPERRGRERERDRSKSEGRKPAESYQGDLDALRFGRFR
ncbi:hypothetical protein BDY24DRAFT_398429 [Mrakia frigida]|uniref:uncharacterized protein n=1 Tax=Mrakia frigida TaxID=29902 RepID=UPI003FCC0CF2